MSISVGIIGLGTIAACVHLPGIEKSRSLKLAAICDTREARLKEIGDKYEIPEEYRFADYRELIHCPAVQAVDICTPNDCHYPMAMEAAAAQKPYAVEKPVTMNKQEAKALLDATEKAGVKSMVCFSYRFKAAARYARELVRAGVLGEIHHVHMQYLQSWARREADIPLVWRYVKSRAGSGALGDLGCHALDLARFVTGREYEKVAGDADTFVQQRRLEDGTGMGVSDVDDYCHCLARMQGNVSASFQITRLAYGRGNYQRLEVYGEKGALVYLLDAEPGADELEICIGQPMGDLNLFTKVPVPGHFAADQMQSFADLLLGKEDGLVATIWDGYMNQLAVDALLESFQGQKWVALSTGTDML